MSRLLSFPCALALALASCASFDAELLKNHVIAADADGNAIDALFTGEAIANPEAAFADVFRAADAACDAASQRFGQPHRRKLLVHVHGGLNDYADSLSTATRACRAMTAEASWEDWHYPIFLVWPSGLISNYGQSLFYFRQGTDRTVVGPLTMPIVFVSDLLAAVARVPKNLTYMLLVDGGTAFASLDWNSFPDWLRADDAAEAAARLGFHLQLGEKNHSALYYAGRATAYVLTFATKLVSEVALDAFGTQTWLVMQHRCYNTFHPQAEFEKGNGGTFRPAPSGVFGRFFAALDAKVKADKAAGIEDEITLVGHSMGTIILNEALRSFPDLPIADIVYMGAACSVEDARDAVLPVLAADKDVHFHVLTLYPLAETSEAQWSFLDLPARGSLLEWIDHWYSQPTSHAQMVLGKWVNAVLGLHLFADHKDQIYLRGFGFDGVPPQTHGEFNECPFWRHDFWWQDPPPNRLPTLSGKSRSRP